MSHGGGGWLKAVEGPYPSWKLNMQYYECSGGSVGQTEVQVPICRVTITPMPEATSGSRRAASVRSTGTQVARNTSNESKMVLTGLLREGFVNGRAKGCQKMDFAKHVSRYKVLKAVGTEDAKVLHSYLKGNPHAHLERQRYFDSTFKQSRIHYTAKNLFVDDFVQQPKNERQAAESTFAHRDDLKVKATKEWDNLSSKGGKAYLGRFGTGTCCFHLAYPTANTSLMLSTDILQSERVEAIIFALVGFVLSATVKGWQRCAPAPMLHFRCDGGGRAYNAPCVTRQDPRHL